jgi:Family of unknown function (DUF6160)
MKHLRKLALASAVSAVAAGAHADLQVLDDESMQNVSGQAGLTIDVESRWEIGEFAYKDAGFLLLQGLRMGGHDLNDESSSKYYLDNLRLEIDIAGDGSTPGDNELHYGFSAMRDFAALYAEAGNSDTAFDDAVNGIDTARSLAIDDKKVYGDGDLVIHFDITDPWRNEGGLAAAEGPMGLFANQTFEDFEVMTEHAVDFRFEIDAIGIAASTYTIGDKGLDIDGNHTTGLHEGQVGTTTLISQLGIQGYLGPEDLHISNNGNGFGATDTNNDGVLSDAEIAATSTGFGAANSKITWGSYFKVTDLDVYIDIAGVQIKDMAIHNERGDLSGLDGTSSFNFAHSIREIYAIKDDVVKVNAGINGLGNPVASTEFVDGIAINTRFKGDIDIKHLSFGDTDESIGEIYLTDVYSDTRWTISAH